MMNQLDLPDRDFKAYTCFCFKGYKPVDLHCTHSYFNFTNQEEVEQSVQIIKKYFSKNKFIKKEWVFDVPDFFGTKNNIPVLRMNNELCNQELFLDLRSSLPNRHGFLKYNPHITTNLEYFKGVVDRYSIVIKNDQLREEVYTIFAHGN